MSYVMVDVESDGPIPGDYSMVCFGAVIVEPSLTRTYYGGTRPISNEFVPEALAISGISREEHLTYSDPKAVFEDFEKWILENNKNGRPVFWSDNLAYDWQWVNFYFHYYVGRNPFGFSGRRIGDVYAGLTRDTRAKWKHLRKTKHTHNPVDDAIGNAEAMLEIEKMGIQFR